MLVYEPCPAFTATLNTGASIPLIGLGTRAAPSVSRCVVGCAAPALRRRRPALVVVCPSSIAPPRDSALHPTPVAEAAQSTPAPANRSVGAARAQHHHHQCKVETNFPVRRLACVVVQLFEARAARRGWAPRAQARGSPRPARCGRRCGSRSRTAGTATSTARRCTRTSTRWARRSRRCLRTPICGARRSSYVRNCGTRCATARALLTPCPVLRSSPALFPERLREWERLLCCASCGRRGRRG